MNARQFARARQPITVSFGARDFIATDWSPSGFRLHKGLAHGYQDKWYPVTLTITDPQNPVVLTGKAQARWSTATDSGFTFISDTEAAEATKRAALHPAPTASAPPTSIQPSLNPLAGTYTTDLDTPDPTDPPTLTHVVRAGTPLKSTATHSRTISQPESSKANELRTVRGNTARTSKPSRETTTPGSAVRKAPNYSRIGFAPARIVAPYSGKVDALHCSNGDRVAKGQPLISVSGQSPTTRQKALLEQQQVKRNELESIQRGIMKWQARARDIDSSDGIDIPRSRREVGQALLHLNQVHESQKLCRGPMSRYQEANVEYRRRWKQHREAIRKAESNAIERTQSQLKQARFKLNQLQKRHQQTIQSLDSLSRELAAFPASEAVTIKSPFNGFVRGIGTLPGHAFEKDNVLMQMENHSRPMAEVLVSAARLQQLKRGDVLNTRVVELDLVMKSKVVDIIAKPDASQLRALGYQKESVKAPSLLRLSLIPGSEKLSDLENLRNRSVQVQWPKGTVSIKQTNTKD